MRSISKFDTPTVPPGRRSNYRDASKSMSACIRSLYSSDQWAPGFRLALLRGCGSGSVLLSLGDLRTPAFSLSVTRGDLGSGDEFESFMQLNVAPFGVGCAAVLALAKLSAEC
jgi:hypothetical protein